MIGLVGRKVGMTRIFNEDGVSSYRYRNRSQPRNSS
jgi:ribosomal protein L3